MKAFPPFVFDAGQQIVLYFDFELSGRQFETRYVDEHKNRYEFSPNLYRAELNPLLEVPEDFRNFEDYICHMIAHEVMQVNASVVIIDNITYLRSETERAKDALPLMKQLKALFSQITAYYANKQEIKISTDLIRKSRGKQLRYNSKKLNCAVKTLNFFTNTLNAVCVTAFVAAITLLIIFMNNNI